MTLFNVFERLRTLDRAATYLFRDTGFQPGEGLGDPVCPLPDRTEDAFLREQAEGLLELLTQLHETLRYLKRPTHGEYTLEQFPSGRYGYFDKDGGEHIFTCGDPLEAKIHDSYDYGRQRWVMARIEHNGSDYFLWGYRNVPLSGLTVRERGRQA